MQPAQHAKQMLKKPIEYNVDYAKYEEIIKDLEMSALDAVILEKLKKFKKNSKTKDPVNGNKISVAESLALSFARASRLNLLKYVIEKLGASITTRSADVGTLMHEAATQDNDQIVQYLLTLPGMRTNEKNAKNETPLMIAAQRGNKKIVALLIKAKIDLDEFNDARRTALFFALKENHIEIVKLLLEAGASIDFVDKNGMTPLLHTASSGYLEAFKLLHSQKANLKAICNLGYSAMLMAAEGGHINILQCLEKIGVDFSESSPKDGENAIHVAARHNQVAALQFLIERKVDVNHCSFDGVSPLMLAVSCKKFESVKLLLAAGANPNIVSQTNHTAIRLSLIKEKFDPRIFSLLLDIGAKSKSENSKPENSKSENTNSEDNDEMQQIFQAMMNDTLDAVPIILDKLYNAMLKSAPLAAIAEKAITQAVITQKDAEPPSSTDKTKPEPEVDGSMQKLAKSAFFTALHTAIYGTFKLKKPKLYYALRDNQTYGKLSKQMSLELFHRAMKMNDVERMEVLLSSTCTDRDGLPTICLHTDIEEPKEASEQPPYLIEYVVPFFYYACAWDKLEMAKLFIKYGAKADDSFKTLCIGENDELITVTPLKLAALKKSPNTFQYLLAKLMLQCPGGLKDHLAKHVAEFKKISDFAQKLAKFFYTLAPNVDQRNISWIELSKFPQDFKPSHEFTIENGRIGLEIGSISNIALDLIIKFPGCLEPNIDLDALGKHFMEAARSRLDGKAIVSNHTEYSSKDPKNLENPKNLKDPKNLKKPKDPKVLEDVAELFLDTASDNDSDFSDDNQEDEVFSESRSQSPSVNSLEASESASDNSLEAASESRSNSPSDSSLKSPDSGTSSRSQTPSPTTETCDSSGSNSPSIAPSLSPSISPCPSNRTQRSPTRQSILAGLEMDKRRAIDISRHGVPIDKVLEQFNALHEETEGLLEESNATLLEISKANGRLENKALSEAQLQSHLDKNKMRLELIGQCSEKGSACRSRIQSIAKQYSEHHAQLVLRVHQKLEAGNLEEAEAEKANLKRDKALMALAKDASSHWSSLSNLMSTLRETQKLIFQQHDKEARILASLRKADQKRQDKEINRLRQEEEQVEAEKAANAQADKQSAEEALKMQARQADSEKFKSERRRLAAMRKIEMAEKAQNGSQAGKADKAVKEGHGGRGKGEKQLEDQKQLSEKQDKRNKRGKGFKVKFHIAPSSIKLSDKAAINEKIAIWQEQSHLEKVLSEIDAFSKSGENYSVGRLIAERNAMLGICCRAMEIIKELKPEYSPIDPAFAERFRNAIFHAKDFFPVIIGDLGTQKEFHAAVRGMVGLIMEGLLASKNKDKAELKQCHEKINAHPLVIALKQCNLERMPSLQECQYQWRFQNREIEYYPMTGLSKAILEHAKGFALGRLGAFASCIYKHYPDEYEKNKQEYQSAIQNGVSYRHVKTKPGKLSIHFQFKKISTREAAIGEKSRLAP